MKNNVKKPNVDDSEEKVLVDAEQRVDGFEADEAEVGDHVIRVRVAGE